jgi:SNF2 family DNA or RNA helicase
MKCCGKILCADCGVQGNNLTRKGNCIQGKCPHCRSIIGFNDLVFINEGFDLDSIITEKRVGGELKEPTDKCVERIIDEPKTKVEILLRILKGECLPNKRKIDVNIKGMLTGIKELPEAPPEHRKVIVFSKFDESLNDMEKQLKEKGVHIKRLCGTASQLHATACEFHDSYDGNNNLLINGEKYSSGRNFQSATDLVFMHKMLEKNIEAQIVGRIQRQGRVYKSHIHYILYNEEARIYG